MTTQLTLHRDRAFVDWFREYKVIIDGEVRGAIKNGGQFACQVEPGTHTLRLAVDWCTSNELSFDTSSNQPNRFACSTNIVGLRFVAIPFYALVKPKAWIRIWRDE